MDTDRNLLFGAFALQGARISPQQFAEACAAWVHDRGASLPDLLEGRGWITPAGRQELEQLVERRLQGDGGVKTGAPPTAATLAYQSLSAPRNRTPSRPWPPHRPRTGGRRWPRPPAAALPAPTRRGVGTP